MLASDEEACDCDCDSDSSSHDRPPKHVQNRHILAWSLLTLTLLLFLVTLTVSSLPISYIPLTTLSPSSSTPNPPPPPLTYASLPLHDSPTHGLYITCSSPPHPNCTFDLLANGWIPSPCFSPLLYKTHMSNQNFPFYRHLNGSGLVHQATIMRGDLDMFPDGLWVTAAQHRAHCAYLVEGAVRATARAEGGGGGGGGGRGDGGGILDTFLNEGHMRHCFGVVAGEDDNARLADGEILKNVKAFFQMHRCYVGRALAAEKFQVNTEHSEK